MQIVKVGNVYLVVKQGTKLTPEQIKSYQSKPEPDLTLAIWSDFPDFNPSLSRELNKLRKQTYTPKQGALQNELSDNKKLSAEITARKQKDNKKYVVADYTISDKEIPADLQNVGLIIKRDIEFYELKYDEKIQKAYWADEKGNKKRFNNTRAECEHGEITIFDSVLVLDKEIADIIKNIEASLKRIYKREDIKKFFDNLSEKEKTIYNEYRYRRDNFQSGNQKHFSLAHELKHIRNKGAFKQKTPHLNLESRLKLMEHDEKSAHIEEALRAIEEFYKKARNLKVFPKKCDWLVQEIKNLKKDEQDKFLQDMEHILNGVIKNWDNEYSKNYRKKGKQFVQQIQNMAYDVPLNELQNSDEDYKAMLSEYYRFDVYNPQTGETESKDLSSLIEKDVEITEEQRKDYLNLAEKTVSARQKKLNKLGLSEENITAIYDGTLPAIFEIKEEQAEAEPITQVVSEDEPQPVKSDDKSFKEPYRTYYQNIAKRDKSKYLEDKKAENFSAALVRENGDRLEINASADNHVSLGAKDQKKNAKIPDYKDFDDLVKLLKSQGKTVSLGDIRTPEYKARLVLACLKAKVEVEPMPDFEKTDGLEPETLKRLRIEKNKRKGGRRPIPNRYQNGR